MYKACIFDLDGTLTDTLESLTYSVNATLRELGLSQITDEQCKAFVGSGARKLIETYFDKDVWIENGTYCLLEKTEAGWNVSIIPLQ